MSKPRALLVHSGGLSSRQWRRLAAALAPTHDVIAPELLGYAPGAPWPAGAPFHFRQDVDALAALLAGAPAQLVGHSYGGFLALQLALAHPALVTSLALYEPVAFGVLDAPFDAGFVPWHADASGVDERWLAAFVEWWNGAGAWAALAEPVRAQFRTVGWKLYQEVATLMADRTSSATYGTIAVPALLLAGGRTPAPERRVVERLAAVMPRATRIVFDDLGHMGPITDAARVDAAIVQHLRAT